MFGKEYAGNFNILIQSFVKMNDQYRAKIKKNQQSNIFIENLKKLYILMFGVPEIGLQIRSIYFKKTLTSEFFYKSPKKIFDAGSGIGIYTFWLGQRFNKARITGGEIDKDKLKFSHTIKQQLHPKVKNVDFVYFDITKLHKKPRYDLIICIDVLEHINDYEMVLKNFYHLLHKNGYIYIHVPQPNQKRIFSSFNTWHHKDHIHEGITKNTLENTIKKLRFKIITSEETFGFFGKLAWEFNHQTLSKSFVLAGITFPFLYILAMLDQFWKNKNGLGVAVLAQKNKI